MPLTYSDIPFGSSLIMGMMCIRGLVAFFHYLLPRVSENFRSLSDENKQNCAWHASRIMGLLFTMGFSVQCIPEIALDPPRNSFSPHCLAQAKVSSIAVVASYTMEIFIKPKLNWVTVVHHIPAIFLSMIFWEQWPINLVRDNWFLKELMLYGWMATLPFLTNVSILAYRLTPTKHDRLLRTWLLIAFANDLLIRIAIQAVIIAATVVNYHHLQYDWTRVFLLVFLCTSVFAEVYGPFVVWQMLCNVRKRVGTTQNSPNSS